MASDKPCPLLQPSLLHDPYLRSHKFLYPLNFSEVLKALLKTRDLYERWRLGDEGVEIRSSEEQEWAATGQLISECLFDVINFPKKQRKNLTNFCPRI